MIKLVNAYYPDNPVVLTKKESRGSQNFLTELPSGIQARYFEERAKSNVVICMFL